MRKICIVLLLPFLSLLATAQQKVFVKGKPGNQYIEHKVGEKESLSSIGRLYDITASQLARFNGRSPSSVLTKGVVLKVPYKAANLHTKVAAIAVYHRVGKGDNLFKLGQQYNKVPVTQLRTWNKLGAKDGVKNGQELLVGYLGAATGTLLAEEKSTTPATQTLEANPQERTEPVQQKEESVAAVKQSVTNPITETTPQGSANNTDKSSDYKGETVMREDDSSYVPTEGDEGYFARDFIRHDLTLAPKNQSGMAATFKTVSGWTDRKFYVMINGVMPGTIVRITAPNNRSICARVLSSLPEVKGAEGLILRMSNSAASALGMKEESFSVSVSYFE